MAVGQLKTTLALLPCPGEAVGEVVASRYRAPLVSVLPWFSLYTVFYHGLAETLRFTMV